MSSFKILGNIFSGVGCPTYNVKLRLCERLKDFGAMNKMCNVNILSLGVKMELLGGVVMQTGFYRAQTSSMKNEESCMQVISEMKCLRNVCKVIRTDIVLHKLVRFKDVSE